MTLAYYGRETLNFSPTFPQSEHLFISLENILMSILSSIFRKLLNDVELKCGDSKKFIFPMSQAKSFKTCVPERLMPSSYRSL